MASSTAFSPPHSCDFCQNLVLYHRDKEWWKKALRTSPDIETHIKGLLSTRVQSWLRAKIASKATNDRLADYAIFDCTLGEARLAAIAGCNFCVAITNIAPRTDHGSCGDDNLFLAGQLSSGLFGILSPGKRKLPQIIPTSKTHFEILALLNNPASREILTRPINNVPSSKESFHQVQGWQRECLKMHQNCPKLTENFMPTRVLEIVKRAGRNDYQLRLRETSSMEPEPYAALSYCWGGPQTITTTNDSYQRHSLIIDKQALPASVRDAVFVAENIGMKYLWIDAFCILQDDQTDKNWEIVQMPLIYRQAAVTIVASRARGVTDGFLHERPIMGADTPDQVFELPFRCSDNRLGSVLLLPRIDPSTEPLDLRAWPLQERFLSPRIIEYGSIQTRWICQTSLELKGHVDGFKDTGVDNKERSDHLFTGAWHEMLATSESTTSDTRRKALLQYWDNMLKAYTHRALTLGTDRLPAISGIAAQFGKSLCDEYKAGLWRSDMELQLLWRRDGLFSSREDLKSRPIEYQGPSWSWAAINDPIHPRSSWWDSDSHVDSEVVDYNIEIDSTRAYFSVYDPSFGAVESASLQLRGRLGPIECTFVKRSSKMGFDQWIFKKKHDTGAEGNLRGNFYFDALEAEFADGSSGTMPAFLIKVLGPVPRGLILRHIKGSKFSRLGVFEFDHRSRVSNPDREQIKWLNGSPIETITLI